MIHQHCRMRLSYCGKSSAKPRRHGREQFKLNRPLRFLEKRRSRPLGDERDRLMLSCRRLLLKLSNHQPMWTMFFGANSSDCKISVAAQNRLVCVTDNESAAAEAFRLLGVRLRDLRRQKPLRKVLITSTIPQEGKSMVSANLACTLSLKVPEKTLLVEGDLRRPSLSEVFGIERVPGLNEWLQGERTLADSIYHLEGAGTWILPAGNSPSNPLELLQSGKLPELMEQLTRRFDWVIIDSPPILPLADTSVWMRQVDGVLLVAREGDTEKRQLQRGLEAIDSKKLIGAVMNGSTNPANNSYYYYRKPAMSSHNEGPDKKS